MGVDLAALPHPPPDDGGGARGGHEIRPAPLAPDDGGGVGLADPPPLSRRWCRCTGGWPDLATPSPWRHGRASVVAGGRGVARRRWWHVPARASRGLLFSPLFSSGGCPFFTPLLSLIFSYGAVTADGDTCHYRA